MKKLFALAILSTVSLAKPCFGVDWIRDRIYISYGQPSGLSLGYHYTDSVKISVQPVSSVGALANLHYRYEFTNTDITPYISAGVGAIKTEKYDFLCRISAGANLPISSRTSVFAGYHLLTTFKDHNHGIEWGINFNL